MCVCRSKALSGVQEKLSSLSKENYETTRSKSRSCSRGRKSSSKTRENSVDGINQDDSGKKNDKENKRSSSTSSER